MSGSGSDRRRSGRVPHRPESRPRGRNIVGGAFQVDHASIAYGTQIDSGNTSSTRFNTVEKYSWLVCAKREYVCI